MAKVVDPTNSVHKIQYQSRFSSGLDLKETSTNYFLFLKNESTNIETAVPLSTTTQYKNNIIQVVFPFTFNERDKYQIRIMFDNKVFYRGKLFATVQETQNFVITEGFIKY